MMAKKKYFLALLILLGITVNILTCFFFRQAEFSIILIVFLFPSSAILLFCFLLIWTPALVGSKKNILVFFIFLGLSSSFLVSLPTIKELHLRIFKKNDFAYREFMRKDIAPIENGKWEYSKNGVKLAEIDFKNGKIHGEYNEFDLNGGLMERSYYNAGELDSMIRYKRGNRIESFKYLGDTSIHVVYQYNENNVLTREDNFYFIGDEFIKSDTIKLN